ncbi:YadA C-terminal domain-containing protein [Vibrio bathopelagicus]
MVATISDNMRDQITIDSEKYGEWRIDLNENGRLSLGAADNPSQGPEKERPETDKPDYEQGPISPEFPEDKPGNDRPDWENSADRIQATKDAAHAAADQARDQYQQDQNRQTIREAAQDVRISSNTNRIDNLEAEMRNMGDKMLELDDRMDGVVASSHAIMNARPSLNSVGDFGVGVGMGFAGSKEAIALGGAYAFNENWSASASLNYETSGKFSDSQVSGGAGVQYTFK